MPSHSQALPPPVPVSTRSGRKPAPAMKPATVMMLAGYALIGAAPVVLANASGDSALVLSSTLLGGGLGMIVSAVVLGTMQRRSAR